MKPTLNEKFLAYLALFGGIVLSVIAEYYSILGLTAIFAAAVLPVIIMGIGLGIGKVTATLWLKQNWNIAPRSIRAYLIIAIAVLMMITSMGIFGFLSKAHSDHSLVSGDVMAKISVYDEKIKTSKDNIDANRKALKQLDEAVDQTMGRSTTETGAAQAVNIRRSQRDERRRLLSEIQAEQATVTQLHEDSAPIRAEVRKVESEVGPIKYIAAFVYGDTNAALLEKAVTWVIILLIVVFDPLAVVLLLASQISFQQFRERAATVLPPPQPPIELPAEATPDVVENINTTTISSSSTEPFDFSKYPYLLVVPENRHPPGIESVGPLVYTNEIAVKDEPVDEDSRLFVQNEEQRDSNLWTSTATNISSKEYANASIAHRNKQVDDLVQQVKEGRVQMSDVPEHLLTQVKARV